MAHGVGSSGRDSSSHANTGMVFGADPSPPEIDYRFVLANERTFLAWIRTALGIIAGGVALDQFVVVGRDHQILGPLSIAVVILGAGIALIGTIRWHRTDAAMRAGHPLRRSHGILIIGIAVVTVAIMVGVLLAFG